MLAAVGSGEHDGDSPDFPLPALATWALERVTRDPDGFFLLLEHEGIDTASHHGATARLEASLLSLDETVEVVLQFAERHGDILVVVAGDHDTGGLQLQGTNDRPQVVWTTDGHTGESVPLFASGPGATRFAGSLDSAGVGRALASSGRRDSATLTAHRAPAATGNLTRRARNLTRTAIRAGHLQLEHEKGTRA